MAGVNKCFIIGHLGSEPTVTYTQSGAAVAKISVATTEKWKDKQSGEPKELTEWHRVKFFGKQAETIGSYCHKGMQLYVEGRLQTSSYEKDGITRYSTEIIGSSFQFLGSKSTNNQQGEGGYNPSQAQRPSQGQQSGFGPAQGERLPQGDNSIPF